MKKRFILVCSALIGAILLWLAGHLILPADTKNRAPMEIQNPGTVYADSLSGIHAAQDIILNISITRETAVNDAVFTETTQQQLAYLGIGTENICASLNETICIDDYTIGTSEIYSDSTCYVTVNDSAFSGTITPEDYRARFAPAILLDLSRYQNITGFNTGTNYMIRFEQPMEAESWAMPEDAILISAEGTAFVSYDGILTGSIYVLSFQQGYAEIKLTYQVYAEPVAVNIALPEDNTQYQEITDLDAPRMLERATGYLLQADHVSAKYRDDIYCEAFGDRKIQEIALHTIMENNVWSALVKTQSHLTNESKVGSDSQSEKSELFKDGNYQSAINDGQWITNSGVTEENMQNYCKNLLIGTVMLPQYITGAQIEENENVIRIVFTGSEAFAPLICSNICQTLYQQPELLNDIAQSSATNSLQCYLELDRNTSLPIASGIHYEGTFTVEGVPYVLRFQADQIYDILSQSAHTEIDKAGA